MFLYLSFLYIGPPVSFYEILIAHKKKGKKKKGTLPGLLSLECGSLLVQKIQSNLGFPLLVGS